MTATPPLSPPEDDSQIAKSAVVPGLAMASRAKTLTLSHSFTVVVVVTKATFCAVVGDWVALLGVWLGAGVDALGVGDGLVVVGVIAGDDCGADGDGDVDVDGLVDVGDGLGVMVEVTHESAAVRSAEVPLVPPGLRVRAVVAVTPPTMHRPVMTPATVDPLLQTITRPTPISRS